MSQFIKGNDALGIVGDDGTGGAGSNNSFTPLKSGETKTVKLLGEEDFVGYYAYGSFKPKVATFAAKNPSKKSAKGFPVEEYTPWDLAWKYYQDKSEKFQDKHSQKAYQFKPKGRMMFGFFDLDEAEMIVIDFTAKQAEAILSTIQTNAKRKDRMAFEISKQGANTATTASLVPLPFIEDDLTDKQLENFKNAPEAFDDEKFNGLVYEMDEDEQLLALDTVGFDVTEIGFTLPEKKDEDKDEDSTEEGTPGDEIQESDLPF